MCRSMGQVGQKCPDLRGAHLARMAFVVEEDEAADPVYVGAFGVDGVTFFAQDVPRLVEQFSGALVHRLHLKSSCALLTISVYS